MCPLVDVDCSCQPLRTGYAQTSGGHTRAGVSAPSCTRALLEDQHATASCTCICGHTYILGWTRGTLWFSPSAPIATSGRPDCVPNACPALHAPGQGQAWEREWGQWEWGQGHGHGQRHGPAMRERPLKSTLLLLRGRRRAGEAGQPPHELPSHCSAALFSHPGNTSGTDRH